MALKFVGFLFVDDTDLIRFGDTTETSPITVVTRMQEGAMTWHGGLRATGGALKSEKCFWGLLAYWWHSGKVKLYTQALLPATLEIPDPDGTMVTIKRHDPGEAIKVVSVFQSLDGSMKAQLSDLKERADSWVDAMEDRTLPRKLAWDALNLYMWSSLRYPLPATTFTEEEAALILRRFYQFLIPTLGACRNIPKALRHAPTSLLGLGLPSPYVEQGSAQIRYLLVHGSIPSFLGDAYRISLEQLQLEIGVSTPVLETSFPRYGHLATDCLLKSIWEFLWKHEIRLRGTATPLPCEQRESDGFLMELITTELRMSKREVLGFNRCRLHMEAMTLADVTTGDGTAISTWAKAGKQNTDQRSQWLWPKERPGRIDQTAWLKGLGLLTDPATFKFSNAHRLGCWISRPHKLDTWIWRFDPGSHDLFRRLNGIWFTYRPISPRQPRNRSNFRSLAASPAAPGPTTQLATVMIDYRGDARFEGAATLTLPGVLPSANLSSLRDLINTWPDNWPLDHSYLEFSDGIARAIRDGTAQGVCDGSYMPMSSYHLGTAAWILEAPDSPTEHCAGICRTSGQPTEVNAYRSELQGVHGMLLAIKSICLHHKVTSGNIRLGCDNRTGVNLADQDFLRVTYNRSHVDMIRAIRRLKFQLSPVKIRFEHIYGHQDDGTEFDKLPRMAQLNVQMDKAAKRYLLHLIRRDARNPIAPCPSELAEEGISCWIDGIKMTTEAGPAIRRSALGKPLRDYLHRKELLHTDAFDLVDWEAIGNAMTSLPQLFRLWAAKHASGWCAVGHRMEQWGLWEDSTCPCCTTEPKETPRHLLVCPDPRLCKVWTERLAGFDTWLLSSETHPVIRSFLLRALTARDPAILSLVPTTPALLAVRTEQARIGWFNLTEGKVSKLWRPLQEQHLREIGSRRSARQWIAGLIKNLLEMTHSI